MNQVYVIRGESIFLQLYCIISEYLLALYIAGSFCTCHIGFLSKEEIKLLQYCILQRVALKNLKMVFSNKNVCRLCLKVLSKNQKVSFFNKKYLFFMTVPALFFSIFPTILKKLPLSSRKPAYCSKKNSSSCKCIYARATLPILH